jgi:hypothetical protein
MIRTTCMRLLPLLEMFCKWELQEDCTNLRSFMLRFESEAELHSTDLGRSLLSMVNDEDEGFDNLPCLQTIDPPLNPFDVVRQRLAAVDLAINELQPHVQSLL